MVGNSHANSVSEASPCVRRPPGWLGRALARVHWGAVSVAAAAAVVVPLVHYHG